MGKIPPPDYTAHPLLDPALSERDPAAFRMLYREYLGTLQGTAPYNDLLNRMLHPPGESHDLSANLDTARYYLTEGTQYIRDILQLLPAGVRGIVQPVPEVSDCTDVLELLSMIFMNSDPRTRFEAQRKLYMTKLFFDVDHSRDVEDGVAHKRFFESLLDRQLFTAVSDRRTLDVFFGIGPDGVSMEYSINRETREDQERWSFDLQVIEVIYQGRPIRLHVYFYSCRFKKEIIPYQYQRGGTHYALHATEIWSSLHRRRNGSIVSKMIRKGENDPRQIKDLIGAMFIVEDLLEVEHLKEMLVDLFGGPFRIKNVTDTLSGTGPRTELNPYSGSGYRVFKCELDVLYRPPYAPDSPPYFFPVELQIYTLETYLRTIHTEHYASHQALKMRQFLLGLAPYIFPVGIYGEAPVRLCMEEGTRAGAGGMR